MKGIILSNLEQAYCRVQNKRFANGLRPRISKVFLNHQNIFFSKQVRTILVTKKQSSERQVCLLFSNFQLQNEYEIKVFSICLVIYLFLMFISSLRLNRTRPAEYGVQGFLKVHPYFGCSLFYVHPKIVKPFAYTESTVVLQIRVD